MTINCVFLFLFYCGAKSTYKLYIFILIQCLILTWFHSNSNLVSPSCHRLVFFQMWPLLRLENKGVTTSWLLPYPVYLQVNKSRPPPRPPPSTVLTKHRRQSPAVCVFKAWSWPSAQTRSWTTPWRSYFSVKRKKQAFWRVLFWPKNTYIYLTNGPKKCFK